MDDIGKEYIVIIDASANDRMAEHIEFLARVSESAANQFLDELMASFYSLKTMPFRNPIYNRQYLPRDKYRYLIFGKRYRIVYQIEGDYVFVDDLQDCRQNYDKNILK
jgi:hypothetical protein